MHQRSARGSSKADRQLKETRAARLPLPSVRPRRARSFLLPTTFLFYSALQRLLNAIYTLHRFSRAHGRVAAPALLYFTFCHLILRHTAHGARPGEPGLAGDPNFLAIGEIPRPIYSGYILQLARSPALQLTAL